VADQFRKRYSISQFDPVLSPGGGIGGGLPSGKMGVFGRMDTPMPPAPLQAEKPDTKAEKGYLDSTSGKLAAIGDLMLRFSGRGGNPVLAYKLAEQKEKQQAQAAEQARLAQEQRARQEWEYRQQWERANPKPANPTAPPSNIREFETVEKWEPSRRGAYYEYLDRKRPQQFVNDPWQGPVAVGRGYQDTNQQVGGLPPASVVRQQGQRIQ
jgi:hypothetical protein